MHRVNYDEPEEDRTKLPDGIIQSRSNTGPCYGCGAQLNHGDLALLDWVPTELVAWLAQLAAKLPGWTVRRLDAIPFTGFDEAFPS